MATHEGHEVRHAPLEEDVVNDERAQHVDGPVGEVDDVHHAEHEREPEGHQDVDRADGQPDDRALDEEGSRHESWWGAPTWPPTPPNARSAPGDPRRSSTGPPH